MKHLKLFESFNEKDIRRICYEYDLSNYIINKDGSIDIDGNISLYMSGLNELPLKFNKINGFFDCSYNNLETFERCPINITGDFDCSYNEIRTFEYFPKNIGGEFYCNHNPIYHILKLFNDITKIELFNDMDIIQDGIVLLDRLNYFLEEIGKTTYFQLGASYPITSIKEYKYI